jgi:uncharacterized protein (TIGR03000 family)
MDKARLRVYLPVPDAKLEIQGKMTERTGAIRLFESPPLPVGKNYVYDIKATWSENGKTVVRERSAPVTAGQTTEIDFREDKSAKAPEGKPAAPDGKVKLDVPYVPTPQVVVDEMLKMAKVKDSDVVYDLGCGDGRIVVTAVKKFKAKKGIGIDIDPARIKDSEENAKAEKVTDQVTFKQGDVLKLTEKDLADATVVTLYLFPRINDQLAPILKKLKPGTRIVSHDFRITGWEPDETKTLPNIEDEIGFVNDHTLFLWTIK